VCTTVVALPPCLLQGQLHVADGPTPHSVAWMRRSYPCANLEFSRRLSLLRLCRLSSRRIDIPSWVPNLVHPVKGSLPTQNSSGFSCSHAKTLEAGILAVQGMSCGVVSTISSPYQPKDRVIGDVLAICVTLHRWLRTTSWGPSYRDRGESRTRSPTQSP